MGHAHYWTIDVAKKDLVLERLPQIQEDFKRLLPHLPPLAGPGGTGEPIFESKLVAFNGVAPEHDYESFVFPGDIESPYVTPGFNFCKTGFTREESRPYDLAVRTFLLLAKFHLGPLIEVSSDAPIADWGEPTALIEQALHLPIDVYASLGAQLLVIEDAKARRFVVETHPPLTEEREAYAKDPTEWPFRGPYVLVGALRIPQDDLPHLWREGGYYALEVTR